MEQIWHWIVIAATVKEIAYIIAFLDGFAFYGWYLLFVNEPEDFEWLLVAVVVVTIILVCCGLTLLWTGFPLLIAVGWIYFWLSVLARIIWKKKTKTV